MSSRDFDFKCVGCAACCEGDGHVYVTTKDRVRLSTFLGLAVPRFTKLYCAKTHGEYHLKNPERDCMFLDNGRCSVYEARPDQCRTWPFWPENFYRGKIKKSAVSYCKGIRWKNR